MQNENLFDLESFFTRNEQELENRETIEKF